MSGGFRFLLAGLVVLSHLVGTPYLQHTGFYAVRAFFVLSGFVMTGAINDVYRLNGVGFWINRFLRLVPIYLVVCLATALAIFVYPIDTATFTPRWAFPPTTTAIVQNIIMVPLAFPDPMFRFIAPAWSVAVEIFMYFLLYVGMARSARGAALCLIAGVTYHSYMLLVGAPFAYRYFSVTSALLGFPIGALIYFCRERGRLPLRADCATIAGVAWVINLFADGTLFPKGYAEYTGYYVNIALAACIVASLPTVKLGRLGQRLDAALGHLSYPIFIVQWFGGFIGYMLLSRTIVRGWELVFISAPIILVLAAALAWMQARLVEPLRGKMRNKETPRRQIESYERTRHSDFVASHGAVLHRELQPSTLPHAHLEP
ncbi:MAG: acyltransferase family protein [Methylocella sp.]